MDMFAIFGNYSVASVFERASACVMGDNHLLVVLLVLVVLLLWARQRARHIALWLRHVSRHLLDDAVLQHLPVVVELQGGTPGCSVTKHKVSVHSTNACNDSGQRALRAASTHVLRMCCSSISSTAYTLVFPLG